MLVSDEVIKDVLFSHGTLNHHEIIAIHAAMLERMNEQQINDKLQGALNALYMDCLDKGIKPMTGGIVTEQQACQLLNKSAGYFRQNRHAGRIMPSSSMTKNKYVYSLQALAEYTIKNHI